MKEMKPRACQRRRSLVLHTALCINRLGWRLIKLRGTDSDLLVDARKD
jgi:hypothetical protein